MKTNNINNSFLVKIIFWFLVCILIILSGANTDNMDLESTIYEFGHYTEERQGEWLNFFTEDFFRRMNWSFELYRLFLYGVGYILLFSTANHFFGISFYSLFLYAIYPFTMDFIQTPNFCSMCLIIFSTRYLVNVNKKNIIKYVIGILLAAGMHSMAYLYLGLPLLMLLMHNKDILKFGTKILWIGLVLGITDRAIGFVFPMVQFVTQNDDRLPLYFKGYTKFGFLLYWCTQFILWYMMKYIYSRVLKYETNRGATKTLALKYIKVIYIITCFGLLLMPLVGYAGTIFRIVRNYFVLVYFAWAFFINYYGNNNDKIIYRTLFIAFPVFMYAIESSDTHFFVMKMLDNNWLLNSL